ncbi:MAG: glycosyltransferase, partial [Anaerolineae bacterium]
MRVLVTIFEKLVPISGGGTPRISNVIKAFVARGHEVYVASSIAVSREEAIDRYGCAHWLPIQGVSRLGRWKMPKYMVAFAPNILRVTNYARQLKPDLIVSHNSIAGYSALLAKGFHPQTLTLLDLTDLLFEYLEDYRSRWLRAILGVGRRMERTTIRGSDKIITISQAMKGIACQFGARPQDVDVVPDGVDTDIFRRVNGDDLRQKYAPGA